MAGPSSASSYMDPYSPLNQFNYCLSVVPKANIVGRVEEVNQLLSMILQPGTITRPLLMGKHGIGKSSIVQKLAQHPMMAHRTVYQIDCAALVARDTSDNYMSKAVEVLDHIREAFLSQSGSFAIHLKSIDLLMKKDRILDYVPSFFSLPYPMIGSFTKLDSDEDPAPIIEGLSKHHFYPIHIKENSIEEIETIAWQKIQENPALVFTEEAIKLAVKLSERCFSEMPRIMRVTRIIQESFITKQIVSPSLSRSYSKINSQDVAQYVSRNTGIPYEDLLDDYLFDGDHFCATLNKKIIGQEHAINEVKEIVEMHKAGLLNPEKPWGTFLFVGPTGVGKTELSKQLATILFQNPDNLFIIDGSEYKEEYTVSNLVGSAKGYLGHESGGLLTERLRKNPNLVVLFDEFEKAHKDVQRLFLQVFDRGVLTDRRGITVDCKKAVFIMTTNLGSEKFFYSPSSAEFNPVEMKNILMPILVHELSPEMCGRFSKIIPFQPMKEKHLLDLINVELERMQRYLKLNSAIELDWTDEAVQALKRSNVELRLGARHYCRIVNTRVNRAILEANSRCGRRLKGKLLLEGNDTSLEVFCTPKTSSDGASSSSAV